jgi:hypothetical protein
MKSTKIALTAALAVCLVLAGCASKKPTEAKELTGSRKTEILQHKGTTLGVNELPVWVETYVATGITGLEKLSDYNGFYCFVGESSGKNLKAVQTWASDFEVSQAVAENVRSRVNAKFVGSETGKSGDTYGNYFEGIVDRVADASYSGVRRINDWWVLARKWDANNRASDEYQVYVLYTVEKGVFDQQVLQQIDNAVRATPSTSEEQQAIANVRAVLAREGL